MTKPIKICSDGDCLTFGSPCPTEVALISFNPRDSMAGLMSEWHAREAAKAFTRPQDEAIIMAIEEK